jgi:hypothetical protein
VDDAAVVADVAQVFYTAIQVAVTAGGAILVFILGRRAVEAI